MIAAFLDIGFVELKRRITLLFRTMRDGRRTRARRAGRPSILPHPREEKIRAAYRLLVDTGVESPKQAHVAGKLGIAASTLRRYLKEEAIEWPPG